MFELRCELWLMSISAGSGEGETPSVYKEAMLGLTEGTGPADKELMGPGGHPSLKMRSPPQSVASSGLQSLRAREANQGLSAVCPPRPPAGSTGLEQLGSMPSFLGVPSGSHRW